MVNSKKVKMTLMLDEHTIAILRNLSYKELGQTNVSKSIRLLAKKYETKEQNESKETEPYK